MTPKDTWKTRINIITLSRLEEQIGILCKRKRYEEARKLAEKAVQVAVETYGSDSTHVMTCRNNLAITERLYKSEQDNSAQDKQSIPPLHNKKSFKPISAATIAVSLIIVIFLAAVWANKFFLPISPNETYGSNGSVMSLPFYRVTAAFLPQTRTIEGEEEVFFNSAPKNQLQFNLYFNRYNNPGLDSSQMRRYALANGKDRGYIDILTVIYKGKPVSFTQAGETLLVKLNQDLSSEGRESLNIKFRVKLPYLPDRSGGNASGIWLGNWVPTLKVGNISYPATEIGDPFINISSTYELSMTVPSDYTLVLSNIEGIREQSGTKQYQCRLEEVRDLPLFINRDYQDGMTKDGETEIHYYFLSPGGNAGEVLNIAKAAMAYYKSILGPYPWKQLNIVENDMYLNGMEYSTLLLVSSRAVQNNLEETVFHEVGHQWFYNIVGSDQYRAPYIDEGIVEFLTYYALERNRPRYYPGLRGLDKNLGQFTSWEDYRETQYKGGRKLYESLYVLMGKTEFEKFIKEYYDEYKFSFVTPEEFKAFLTKKIGRDNSKKLLP